MFVDNKGLKIKNHWYYRLDTPNPWGSYLLGQAVWAQGTYFFIPFSEEERKIQYQWRLPFTPLQGAERVKQCKFLVKQKHMPPRSPFSTTYFPRVKREE